MSYLVAQIYEIIIAMAHHENFLLQQYLLPAQDQHGFRREHSTTSALLQLTTIIAVGFSQSLCGCRFISGV